MLKKIVLSLALLLGAARAEAREDESKRFGTGELVLAGSLTLALQPARTLLHESSHCLIPSLSGRPTELHVNLLPRDGRFGWSQWGSGMPRWKEGMSLAMPYIVDLAVIGVGLLVLPHIDNLYVRAVVEALVLGSMVEIGYQTGKAFFDRDADLSRLVGGRF